MNHLLFAFALCAGLAIYPGGLACLIAQLAAAAGRGRLRSAVARLGSRPGPALVALGLAGLVLVPISFPDNPLAPVGISWAAGSSVGNVALSLAGLWGLASLAPAPQRQAVGLGLLGAWSLGLLLLAVAVHSGSWSGLLDARGHGAEAGRLALGFCVPLLGWAWFGGPPGQGEFAGSGWAAAGGMALLLLLPQLQGASFLLTLGAWWLLLLALGPGGVALERFGPPVWRYLGRPRVTATLNTP